MSSLPLRLRLLRGEDAPVIADAFDRIGGNKPQEQYERYFEDQKLGYRTILVAQCGPEEAFAGYGTVCWSAHYPPFRAENIPEIQDLNVLPQFRRQGIATALMDALERLIAERSPVAGIGVGMDVDYGPAQRLYVLRGYVPDGRGLTTQGDRPVHWGETVTVNDDLVLYLTKRLLPNPAGRREDSARPG